MRWVRFRRRDGGTGFGVLEGERVALYEGEFFERPQRSAVTLAIDEVTLIAPCAPSKIIALWNNFHALAAKLGKAAPLHPLYLIKPGSCAAGPGEVIRRPQSYRGKIAYEGELGIVIGRACKDVAPSAGRVSYRMRDGVLRDLATLGEAERRFLFRTDWGYVHQDPALGLRMAVSAGANVGERLMAVGWNHYGRIRDTATSWLQRVEIDVGRIDDAPKTYSGGMRQRLQIARNLVTEPRLVFMDEPTGGLDASVQARLLDLLRGLVGELGLAVLIVTHDLGEAAFLAEQITLLHQGRIIQSGTYLELLQHPADPLVTAFINAQRTLADAAQVA